MILQRVALLTAVPLSLSTGAWAGVIGISYDSGLEQNQVRTINPSTGVTTPLNTFSFASGGWNPGTFSVSGQLNRFYAQSGNETVYTFDAATGQILQTAPGDTHMQVLDAGLGGLLIGINYDAGLGQNQVRTLNPETGTTTLLNTFTFSSGGYFGGTFTVDPASNRFFAQAGDGTLNTFDLTTGQILNAILADTVMDTLAVANGGVLIGINYDAGLGQNQVRTLNPATGVTTLLNTFLFDSGGWYDGTFAVDAAANVFYVQSAVPSLYTFNLTTGQILASQPLDVTMDTLGVVAEVPEPSYFWVLGVTFFIALVRQKGSQ